MDIFISHQTNARDIALVEQVAEHLRTLGADLWYDRDGLVHGQEILPEVQRQIYDRPIFLVILSPDALASTWVRDECTWAFARFRQDPSRVIIPLMSLQVPDDLGREWLFFQQFLRVDMTEPETGLRNLDRALQIGSQTTTDAPENVAQIIQRGRVLSASGKYPEAIAAYDLAVARNDRETAAWYGLGRAHLSLAQHAQALAAFDRMLLHDKKLAPGWVGRGDVFFAVHRWEFALTSYLRACNLDHTFSDAFAGRGHVNLALERYGRAVQWYRQAIVAYKFNMQAYLGCGRALEAQQKYSAALAMYEQALATDPYNSHLYFAKAELLRKHYQRLAAGDTQSRLDEAIDAYQASQAYGEDAFVVVACIAMCYELQGKVGAALREFQSLTQQEAPTAQLLTVWDHIADLTVPHATMANPQVHAAALEQVKRLRARMKQEGSIS